METPRYRRPIVPALAPASAIPLIVFMPPRIIILLFLWLWCLCCPPASLLYIFTWRDLCCLKSPDQGSLIFQSSQQLIETSLYWIQLHNSFLCSSSRRQPSTFPWKNRSHRIHWESGTVTHSCAPLPITNLRFTFQVLGFRI